MPRVICPKCESSVRVPKEENAASVCCAECGHKISLDGDDEYSAEERGSRASAKKRSAKQSSRRVKAGDIVEPDDGEVIKLDATKLLGQTFLCGFLSLIGLAGMIACVTGFLAGLGYLKTINNPTVLLIGTPIGFLVFLVICLVFGYYCFRYIYSFLRQQRYVLGETFLQVIAGAGELHQQLAFDNIAEIFIGDKVEDNGQTYKFIGIDLIEPNRKDTLIPALKFNRDNFGCDEVIFDHYQVPLKELCRKLKKCWKRANNS